MKKVILGLAVTASSLAFAQEIKSSPSITYGAKVGLNVSSISKDALLSDQKSKIGFNVGGFVNIPISSQFSIQPELLYSSLGGKAKYTITQNDVLLTENPIVVGSRKIDRSFTTSINYLTIPVMFQYKALPNLYLEAGPEFGLVVSDLKNKGDETITITSGANTNVASSSYNTVLNNNGNKINSFNLGIGIGAGYYFTPNIGISARYVAGVTNIYRKDSGNNILEVGKGSQGSSDLKNNVFQIGLMYKF
ncbi:porin family protein [Chryseobacterium limigenitum]|uniref:Outer membrane protein beta-barrel domain-containing protein n=1 Tax=Chryseobacterium limigenitum TaxID=1612149 RepID=A0A1K2ID31_9FLAO|nr:porin family protein [Chryseobacterium limigenitum]SFZ90200.1 Outer membrane protein beta-barrel domain-containing protein [Chryseobacterium limigenitum]